MNPIYDFFYGKQPLSIHNVLPRYDNGHFVTFLNPYSTEIAKDYLYLYEKADYICSDGILPIIINKLCNKNRTQRISFDMTSLAPIIFKKLSEDQQSVYFIGSTTENIEAFIRNIMIEYPQLMISGFNDGYLTEEDKIRVYDDILCKKPSTIVIGMGTPLQDKLAYDIRCMGYDGNIYTSYSADLGNTNYTCGGFFHQSVNSVHYYPKYIDRLNLRWLYRIYKEKYILKRILLYYPKFVFNYLFYLIFSNKDSK